MNNRIRGLANLLLKCLFVLVFLGGVLWFIPRFISIENHTQAILKRINSSGPGELSLEQAELRLVPHPGILVNQVNLSIKHRDKPSEVLAHFDTGEFRVILNTLFSEERHLHLVIPRAELFLRSGPNDQWNFFTFLGRTPVPPPSPQPLPSPKRTPTEIERKIEEKSQRLLHGAPGEAYETNRPVFTPNPSFTPTPVLEDRSEIETVRFDGIDAETVDVTLNTADGGTARYLIHDLHLNLQPRKWVARVRVQKEWSESLKHAFAICNPRVTALDKREVFLDLECGNR